MKKGTRDIILSKEAYVSYFRYILKNHEKEYPHQLFGRITVRPGGDAWTKTEKEEIIEKTYGTIIDAIKAARRYILSEGIHAQTRPDIFLKHDKKRKPSYLEYSLQNEFGWDVTAQYVKHIPKLVNHLAEEQCVLNHTFYFIYDYNGNDLTMSEQLLTLYSLEDEMQKLLTKQPLE